MVGTVLSSKSHLTHLFVIAVKPVMSPERGPTNGIIFNKNETPIQPMERTEDVNANLTFQADIVWRNVVYLSYFHLAALYGVYLLITSAKFVTFLFGR